MEQDRKKRKETLVHNDFGRMPSMEEDFVRNYSANDTANDPKKRETNMQARNVLLTPAHQERFVEVENTEGQTMRVASSPRDIKWEAACTILKDRAIVISPWRGSNNGIKARFGIHEFELPFPIMGVRAAGVREMAFVIEQTDGNYVLAKEDCGSRRSRVPRREDDKTKTVPAYATFPVSTEHFIDWLAHQNPEIWDARLIDPEYGNRRPPNSWMLIAEPMGDKWGEAIRSNRQLWMHDTEYAKRRKAGKHGDE